MTLLLDIVRGRPRLFVAALIGIAASVLLPPHLHGLSRALIAWDVSCAALLALSAHLFSTERKGGIAADAERQEVGEWTIFWVTVVGVFASFVAIIEEFSTSKAAPPAERGMHVVLVGATLLLSWLTTHTLFAYRYAHEYYERVDEEGTVARGLAFPEEPMPDYWDFFYFALVLGTTFQVSDVQITSRQLRRLAAAHGLLAFLFNTVIVALSVNIGASLL